MTRVQTESGIRNKQVDLHKGLEIAVITGYEIRTDKWPIHIYIDGKKVEGQWIVDSMDEAFDAGFQVAQQEIEARS
ncbi:hypothetical protein [Caballeronia telluris]|uniref:Uncharacterized protein n=1 Tax=Caballeronia telluris TaxID=326475 RepID=A0A158G2P2_9BURK|nr:hypothetical protein [Caballeronia telluris]SAL26292.1 hypothetical protein AWB66_01526 [Caballeronia telluris]